MIKQVVLVLVLAYVAKELFHMTSFMGYFKYVYDHKPGLCKLVDGVVNGSEDGEQIGGGLVIISSGLRTLFDDSSPTHAGVQGRMFLFDFNTVTAKAFSIKGKIDKSTFNPHGVSVWKSSKGTTYVYVVNHSGHLRHTVEKFEVDSGTTTLTHVKTFADENFRLLNDVAVVGEDAFFTTNSAYTLSSWGNMVERYLQLRWGNVVFYKDGKSTMALTGYSMPNGITYDSTRKILYLMATGIQEIHAFDLNTDYTLNLRQKFPIHTLGDNLDLDPESGDIWIGAHPIGWKALRHLGDKTKRSPSQVLKLSIKANSIVGMVEVYSDNGQQLTGASFVTRYKDSMIVGTVHDKLLHCKINNPI